MDAKYEEAGSVIHAFAATHAVVAFLLANTVVGDTLILTALTYGMISALGRIYGENDVSAQKILGKVFGFVAGTYIAGKLLFWVPGVGNWANAVSTIVVTETIGWTCVVFFSTGSDVLAADSKAIKRAVAEAKKTAKKYKEETKAVVAKMTSEEQKELRILSKRLAASNISSKEQKEITQKIKAIYAKAKARV